MDHQFMDLPNKKPLYHSEIMATPSPPIYSCYCSCAFNRDNHTLLYTKLQNSESNCQLYRQAYIRCSKELEQLREPISLLEQHVYQQSTTNHGSTTSTHTTHTTEQITKNSIPPSIFPSPLESPPQISTYNQYRHLNHTESITSSISKSTSALSSSTSINSEIHPPTDEGVNEMDDQT
ncbi:hypothetical protein BDA99DRAFT_20706 [Phascolomyces articulosus]|uniref:Uncharacterized protein n=1 Tax=Phascolomyces articulosus TaxID=60185 RepID=A0AAD5PJQ2_9FUNG|nr:hypothetical protein BDA99DRAFT_20706 [Phascolomyces articulosus]